MSTSDEQRSAVHDILHHTNASCVDDLQLDEQRILLSVAAERLSIVRYVYLVQIEEGIASAAQRASLEYADAVLIGWPDEDEDGLADLDQRAMDSVRTRIHEMEEYVARFRTMESRGDIEGMTDTLIRITERVADVRRVFQPRFLLPTFAEIRRVVQDEWDEDMGRIDPDGSTLPLGDGDHSSAEGSESQ